MEENKTNILVVQTDQPILEMIQRKIGGQGRNVVDYCLTPSVARSKVAGNPNLSVVVTGERFYSLGSFSSEGSGVELSEDIYRSRPEVLTFRCTTDPRTYRGKIVGDIPKSADHGLDELVLFLDSKRLPELLRTKDWQGLVRTFPHIRFYLDRLAEWTGVK